MSSSRYQRFLQSYLASVSYGDDLTYFNDNIKKYFSDLIELEDFYKIPFSQMKIFFLESPPKNPDKIVKFFEKAVQHYEKMECIEFLLNTKVGGGLPRDQAILALRNFASFSDILKIAIGAPGEIDIDWEARYYDLLGKKGESSTEEVSSLKSEIKRLRKEISNLHTQNSRYKDLNKELCEQIDDLNYRLDKKKRDKKDLKVYLKNAQEQSETLAIKVNELREENSKLETLLKIMAIASGMIETETHPKDLPEEICGHCYCVDSDKEVTGEFYVCDSCEGGPICKYCAKRCHGEAKGHHLKGPITMTSKCHCSDSMKRCKCRCTFPKTGKNYKKQVMFHCETCFPGEPSNIVCEACAAECHRGHELSEKRIGRAYCDCGYGISSVKCRCIDRHEPVRPGDEEMLDSSD